MTQEIKFYYDYKSPFTYLAFAPALELETTHDVRLRFIPHEIDIRSVYGGDLERRPQLPRGAIYASTFSSSLNGRADFFRLYPGTLASKLFRGKSQHSSSGLPS